MHMFPVTSKLILPDPISPRLAALQVIKVSKDLNKSFPLQNPAMTEITCS